MPYGSWINDLPTAFFLVVLLTALVLVFTAAVWQAVDARRPAGVTR